MLIDDPAYLLDQAARFRRLAPQLYDEEARDTFLRLADECELRAEIASQPSLGTTNVQPHIRFPKHRW